MDLVWLAACIAAKCQLASRLQQGGKTVCDARPNSALLPSLEASACKLGKATWAHLTTTTSVHFLVYTLGAVVPMSFFEALGFGFLVSAP